MGADPALLGGDQEAAVTALGSVGGARFIGGTRFVVGNAVATVWTGEGVDWHAAVHVALPLVEILNLGGGKGGLNLHCF